MIPTPSTDIEACCVQMVMHNTFFVLLLQLQITRGHGTFHATCKVSDVFFPEGSSPTVRDCNLKITHSSIPFWMNDCCTCATVASRRYSAKFLVLWIFGSSQAVLTWIWMCIFVTLTQKYTHRWQLWRVLETLDCVLDILCKISGTAPNMSLVTQ